MDFPVNPLTTRVAALSAQRTPPARPEGTRELLQTPGNPNALANRPDNAPGRIPIPATPAESDDKISLVNDQEKAKRESMDYQILEKVVKQRKDKEDDKEPRDFDNDDPILEKERDALPAEAPAQTETHLTVAEVNIEQRRMELRVESRPATPPAKSDPLVLDLNNDGIRTTGIENGVRFDINADGITEKVSVTQGDDAFLALDRNRNGLIDDGSELFGDQNGAANGFAELARYDDNADGVIDRNDSVYANLSLLRFGADGQQSLISLAHSDIQSISLKYVTTDQALNEYDSISQLGEFERKDGSKGTAADLMLAYQSKA